MLIQNITVLNCTGIRVEKTKQGTATLRNETITYYTKTITINTPNGIIAITCHANDRKPDELATVIEE